MLTLPLAGQWQFRQLGEKDWLPASVPGGVHTDLLALGRIPDPFVADNELQVQWVAETDWQYRTTFTAPATLLAADRQFLVCDGLDTLAEVTLNGRLLGMADNAFRRWTYPLDGILTKGRNELQIVFRAPLRFIQARQAEKPLRGGGDIPGGPHLRKAPCQWGWDWGPRLPPIGIWKDLRLEGYSTAKLDDVHLRQTHTGGKVTLHAAVAIEAWDAIEQDLVLKITAPDGQSQTVEAAARQGAVVDLRAEIADPQLWYPNDFGSQPLYDLEVRLQAGSLLLDRRSYRVGLRTIELRREEDPWGESFTFVVNGIPIFAKGADWIPADSFPTRLTGAHLEGLIRSAAQAHMNMLRVWGGGFYEDERFYDLCDRYGILVWQDFVFACGTYPEEAAFAENVRVEAVENVRRLRHRASLALWCGNNEMEQGWADWHWNDPSDPSVQRLKAGYDRMFHQLLPAVVAAEDPDRSYWPSSASSGIPFSEPNGQLRGDVHYWDVWHGRKPFTAYREQFPRFMSEFGFQALPPYETIQTYAAPPDQNMTSYIMEHHQRSGSGNGLMIAQMTDTFRMPRDFQALVYLSMVLQAEGIRYGVEHWRRNRARVSGTLIWQLNDCWPVASWSSLDYYGRWKALHYAARRFYAPLLLSVEDDGARMGIFVTNDTTEAWSGEVRWSLETLAGEQRDSGRETLSAAALATTPVRTLDFGERLSQADRRRVVLVCELWQADERLAGCVATFAPSKHLELADPQIAAELRRDGERLLIDLHSATLARFVELKLEQADVLFSDNYFDLPPGRRVRISAALPAGWDFEQARQALRVRSLVDSFHEGGRSGRPEDG
ncbi:MAG: glycoside hydrolase family 2 protein [Anaerolineales bacterium]|nr:glycoside hydrolase family 2 protein [Anaerolineales bacterium]